MQVEIIGLVDDGRIPNHPSHPLIVYRGAFIADGSVITARRAIEIFVSHDWAGAWINGIYPFHHYHARSHEVLANVGPSVAVQFGGRSGPHVQFETGDVVAIPAGGGHCRIEEVSGLAIVGAYPLGQEDWDLKRETAADYARAKQEIPLVALPTMDPVTGEQTPLFDHWS